MHKLLFSAPAYYSHYRQLRFNIKVEVGIETVHPADGDYNDVGESGHIAYLSYMVQLQTSTGRQWLPTCHHSTNN